MVIIIHENVSSMAETMGRDALQFEEIQSTYGVQVKDAYVSILNAMINEVIKKPYISSENIYIACLL